MEAVRVAAGSHATQDFLRGVLLVGGLCALALALATLPLPLAIGLVAGVIVVLVVLAQPLAGLVLLLLAVPFGSPFNIQVGDPSAGSGQAFNFGPIELVFALTMAGWAGRKVIARELPPLLRLRSGQAQPSHMQGTLFGKYRTARPMGGRVGDGGSRAAHRLAARGVSVRAGADADRDALAARKF